MNEDYNKAIQILSEASVEEGFLASVQTEANYHRIWTRDSVICGLAALKTNNDFLVQTFKSAIETIFKNQHNTGFFPSNVNVKDKTCSYGGPVGRTDNTTWAIIGFCHIAIKFPNLFDLDEYSKKIKKGIHLLDAWEFNGKHLIYMPQSGNWADEYYQHGYMLTEQLLRIWALELTAIVLQDQAYKEKAKQIREVVEGNFHPLSLFNEPYLPLLQRKKKHLSFHYWLAGFNPSNVYTNFDLLANALAIKLNLGSSLQQQILIDEIKLRLANTHTLLPSFDPCIASGQKDYEELKEIYSFSFRNHPGEFHNGGLWPVWNGFLAYTLKSGNEEIANEIHQRVVEACKLGYGLNESWDFNECINGENHMPNGVTKCTWSAAGLILSK